jgi:hypothetical protein
MVNFVDGGMLRMTAMQPTSRNEGAGSEEWMERLNPRHPMMYLVTSAASAR